MQTGAGHHWAHVERVVSNARTIAVAEGADVVVVHLAALMHDVVNLPKDHPDRKKASTMSARAAGEWLKGKLAPPRVALVEEAIRCHSFSAGIEAQSIEAQVLSDADKLDALGAIGIARVFEIGGALGKPLMAEEDPFCVDREADDGVATVDHFYTKLLRLQERFYTATGRRWALARHRYMERFLERMEREVQGADLPPTR